MMLAQHRLQCAARAGVSAPSVASNFCGVLFACLFFNRKRKWRFDIASLSVGVRERNAEEFYG